MKTGLYLVPVNNKNMKNFARKISLICITLLCTATAIAQKAEEALNILLKEHPTQKIYIHYDREYYVSGETIWFKAYLYNDGKPSNLSDNIFLQFCDSKGNIISKERYPVMGAVAKGNIHIPDSLPQGNYYIRALTPVMLNEGEDFTYVKNLYVFRSSGNSPAAKPLPPAVSIQFFPESGNLVEGLLCVTAFKAADQYGDPVETDGIIKTDDGTTIASFHSYHDGIGKFQFKPQAGKKYIAEVETSAGKKSYPLPEAMSAGVVLKVQPEKEGKKFIIARSEKDKANYQLLQLVVQLNNHVVFESDVDFENYSSIEGHLVTDSLPSGILHFTLFNKDGIPLAERLSFIDNGEYLAAATINPLTVNIQKRSLNELELQFPEGIQRSLSVAVVEQPQKNSIDRETIISRFLLTSDIKGYVFNPSWYFEKRSDSTSQGLDNLLLTHGWSRFNWKKVLAREFTPVKYKDRPLISISGIVVDPRTKEPLPYGKLGFIVEGEDSTSQTLEASVDATGHFRIDSAAFFGRAKLFYGYTDKNTKTRPALVIADENETEKAVQLIPASFTANSNITNGDAVQQKDEVNKRAQQVQTSLDQVKQLENVNVNATTSKKPTDIVNDKYTNGAFRGQAKETLDNINDPVKDRSLAAVDYIKNRIQQVEYAGNRFVSRKNFSLASGAKWPVAVFINEQLADVVQLSTIRAVDIALVKFFDAGFVGVGSNFPGGAISVYTKEKLPEERKPDKLDFIEYNGYSITKEFYSPDYSNNTVRHPQVDKRTTLYWSPDLYTDNTSKAVKIRFYNNDISTAFRVIVEGFDASGKLVYAEKIIKSN